MLEKPEENTPLVTELIVGKRLEVLEGRDGWLRVVVFSHATGLDLRVYPGWSRPDRLVERPGWNLDLAAVAPNGPGPLLGALHRQGGRHAPPGR